MLRVEAGVEGDVPAAQGLIEGARRWLRSRQIDQWQDPVPDAVLRADATSGRLFVVRQNSDVVAMVSLSESDSEIWGEVPGRAVYVHRLAVAGAHRGARLGQRLLAWVDEEAAARDAEIVRLDCAADNPGLRRFYERQGFQHIRDVTVTALDGSRQLSSSLYERRLLR